MREKVQDLSRNDYFLVLGLICTWNFVGSYCYFEKLVSDSGTYAFPSLVEVLTTKWSFTER
jgi:hypothetical protein